MLFLFIITLLGYHSILFIDEQKMFHRNGHRKYHTYILTFPWMNKKVLIRYSLCMNRAIEDVFIGRSKIEINLYAILGSFFCPLSFPFPCVIQFHPIYTRYFFFVLIVCPLIIAEQYCSSTHIDYHWLFTCHILLNVIKFPNFPVFTSAKFFFGF